MLCPLGPWLCKCVHGRVGKGSQIGPSPLRTSVEYPSIAILLALTLMSPAMADDQQTSGKPNEDIGALSIEQLMDLRVEGAARHSQTLADAPASVTIITQAEIRKFGYRTLGEALASARGFYITNNRTYRTAGVRGFSIPGDYGNRILVMINGHNLADGIFDSMLWFGVDFPVEMSLVKQIEIIRGPSSALYGTNGIFATINVITISPDEADPIRVTADAGSFGEKKVQVTAATPIGKNAAVLLSGSIFNNSGESPLYLSGFNSPKTTLEMRFGWTASGDIICSPT